MSNLANDVSTTTSPHRGDVSAKEVTRGAAPGPPQFQPKPQPALARSHSQSFLAPHHPALKEHNSDESVNSSSSAFSRSSWSWSRASSDSSSGRESPPTAEYSNKPDAGAAPAAAYRRPSLTKAGSVRSPAQASAALSRRAFAKRTAIEFQLLHPTSHAIVLNFALSPRTCKLQGSRLYAHADRIIDADADDVEEKPLIFDSVRWSPGEGIEEERYDVYLFQSGRFSLDAVADDQ